MICFCLHLDILGEPFYEHVFIAIHSQISPANSIMSITVQVARYFGIQGTSTVTNIL